MLDSKFERLVAIMTRLRGPDGCPWDKEQNLKSLQPMLIEEVYEVIEAVDNRDYSSLKEELGDLLLHVVFHAQLARELGHFDMSEVIDSITDKLVRRHPHVFGDKSVSGPDEVVENWEAIKKMEKEGRDESSGNATDSVLEGIPSRLPALHEAHKISGRVARKGFDWPEIESVFEKLSEEIRELREAIGQLDREGSNDAVEEEIGDIFFVLVNIARFLGVDSESALKLANRKFRSRFQYVEQELARRGQSLEESSLEEMEVMWQKAKLEAC